MGSSEDTRLGAVVVTRNRPHVVDAIEGLSRLPERPPIVVVDNASTDGTPEVVAARFPEVKLIRLRSNAGGGGRNAGVHALDRPYVAFCDDDMFWEPGALKRAADLLDRHGRLAVVAARVLVGDRQALDPTCAEMAASPLPNDAGLPGVPVLGFLAGAAVVRRDVFLAAGGFDWRYGVGGEEEPLALRLVDAGWRIAYVDELEAHHHPSQLRGAERTWIQRRNALWTAWLHRPRRRAVADTIALARAGLRDPGARAALRSAAAGAVWTLRARRQVSPAVEGYLALVEGQKWKAALEKRA